MIARVMKSVVTVRAFANGQGISLGSGFFVGDGKTVATNFHVVDGATEILIEFSDGTALKATGFVKAIPERDIAILNVEYDPAGVTPLVLSASTPVQGDRVFGNRSRAGV